jgi:beta-glucosidase
MKYQELIGKMTLEEKCSLLSGKGNFTTKPIERLGIPSMFLSDGPHGLRKQEGTADHLGLNKSLPATCYPTAATMANSWDTELAEELGRYLGTEAAAQGVSVLLGPGLNIKRSPLCGRNFEYFSEDPFLAGKMAAAYVRGIQSKGVSACLKHYAANNQELRRMHSDSVLDERTLREIYLTGFEIAVKEGRPLSVMTSYNKVNGVYANEHEHLLKDILVDEWGFDGLIVTDWGGSNDRVKGLIAGNQLEMPATDGDSDREIAAAVRDGSIPEALVDQRVDEYLKVLFATVIPPNTPDFDKDSHHAFARKAAESTIILLKNENAILPLKPGAKTAVIGDFAQKPRYQGAGSSMVNPTRLDSPLDCLSQSNLEIIGYAPGYLRHGGEDVAKLKAAVDLAQQAEVVLLYMGPDEILESEGMDREHLQIRPNQSTLLGAVSAVNPHVVVVLSGGAPIEVPWLYRCKALICGYLGGQAGAEAMVDALTGRINPSGKLAETWPVAYQDIPAHAYYPGREKISEYREGLFVGYRYYETAAIPVHFPFGYGLSYTSFAYSDLTANAESVSFTLTNTGKAPGAEIAQVYVSAKNSAVFRPVRELKAFTKVFLLPDESKTVTLFLDDKAFRYYNPTEEKYDVECGIYTLQIGASVSDIKLETDISVPGKSYEDNGFAALLPSYYSGNITQVSDAEFENLLGRPIPEAKWDQHKPFQRNDTFSQLYYAKGRVGRLTYKILTYLKNRSEKKSVPDLNILFIYNMPFRGIAKMMGGAVDIFMVDALLEIFNGHFFKGIAHLIAAWFRKKRAAGHTKQNLTNTATINN